MTVDAIAKREGVRLDKKLSKAAVARCSMSGQSVLLAKPLTYMNLSGESVSGLAKFYKVSALHILAVNGFCERSDKPSAAFSKQSLML